MAMTNQARLKAALDGTTDIDPLIRYAYYAGKTAAAKTVCDEHARRLAAMRTAADGQRYYRLAHKIITAGQVVRRDPWTVAGNPDAIYHPDYAGDYPETFGEDETNL